MLPGAWPLSAKPRPAEESGVREHDRPESDPGIRRHGGKTPGRDAADRVRGNPGRLSRASAVRANALHGRRTTLRSHPASGKLRGSHAQCNGKNKKIRMHRTALHTGSLFPDAGRLGTATVL